jgi:2-polyprenyl-6-methoxyphenol hydroxylase-like FAD-dependent oxidoreductase
LEEIQAVLDRRGPGGIKATAPIWLAAFRINERKVAYYRDGRVFLAGDAAHIHSPAGGQGMNCRNAGRGLWKLALACRGGWRRRRFDSYSLERSAVGDEVPKAPVA